MDEYVVQVVGGLGDVLLRYLLPGDCGRVPALRRRGAKVHCALMYTNPNSAEVLAPLFDSMHCEAWDGDRAGFLRRTAGRAVDAGEWERPDVFLTDEEVRTADVGPFVAIHPFAATPNRDWSKRVDLAGLVDALCDSGLTVALLGGSSVRADDLGTRRLAEVFELERPGLVNMVGRASVRLQAHMAMTADRFIGSFSAYHCAAFAVNAKALVLAGEELRGFFSNPHPFYGTMSQRDCTQIHYFEDGGTFDRIVNYAKGLQ